MPAVLSDLERNILDYMVRYLRTHTYQPSIREIGEEFGIKSTKTVSEHLSALAEKGYLERDPSRSRGVRILGVDLSPNTVSVPCYGALPDPGATRRTAGVETWLNVDRRLSGANGAYFVRARGGEYSAVGIEAGDLFLVEPVDVARARDGDLVVVGRGDGQALYRFLRTGRGATLQPADGGEPLRVERVDDVPVSGRVTGRPPPPPRPADRAAVMPPFLPPDPRLPGTPRALDRPGLPSHLIETAPQPGDRRWMARALERAREAWLVGEVPVGAVVVSGDRLLAEGANRTLAWNDPTAHAEVVALREAARRAGAARLPGATLYVTLEPCAQCAGAAVLARVARVVYGASDPKAGMAGSLGNLLQDPRLNHRAAVTRGVLGEASAELLRAFFRERREAR